MTGFFNAKPYYLMGIVNTTPDSFSDGGRYLDTKAAVNHARALIDDGADIIDIGGESTRPNAAPVSPEDEQARILPVIKALQGCGATLSVDTRNAATLRAALDAGASMLNDVSALTHDPAMLSLVAGISGPVCLMHMKGDPASMQQDPIYKDVVDDIYMYLSARMDTCVAAGIAKDRLVIDPGIGFGKTVAHNLSLLANLARFTQLGVPVMVGASRKRFIGMLDRDSAPNERLAGSLAAVLAAYNHGARIFRVHDVAATRQALAISAAIRQISISSGK